MKNSFFLVVLLIPFCSAALVADGMPCVVGETCNSGYGCCISEKDTSDVSGGRRTCRLISTDCIQDLNAKETITTMANPQVDIVISTTSLSESATTATFSSTALNMNLRNSKDAEIVKSTPIAPLTTESFSLTSPISFSPLMESTSTMSKSSEVRKSSTSNTLTPSLSTISSRTALASNHITKASFTSTNLNIASPTRIAAKMQSTRTTSDNILSPTGKFFIAAFPVTIRTLNTKLLDSPTNPITLFTDPSPPPTSSITPTPPKRATTPKGPTKTTNKLKPPKRTTQATKKAITTPKRPKTTTKRIIPTPKKNSTPKTPAKPPPPPPPVNKNTVPVIFMPTGFKGVNVGIGSWFQANKDDSHTNGMSWCGYPYKDYTNGFAPDITIMTNGGNYKWPNPGWFLYGRLYCGLEAIVTNPATGVSRVMYIADAFDHRFVRSPGSIDIMKGKFEELYGRRTNNHNNVIYGVRWVLTGRRSLKYAFGGPGDDCIKTSTNHIVIISKTKVQVTPAIPTLTLATTTSSAKTSTLSTKKANDVLTTVPRSTTRSITKSTTTTTKKTATTTTQKKSPSPNPPPPNPDRNIVKVDNMPSGFRGVNHGIGSWFQANTWYSNTNGQSWCGYPYKDHTNGFAPDISIMTNYANSRWPDPGWYTSGRLYCGLEAIVTNPSTGVSRVMYITDAFDHAYVRSPGSIDIMKGKFHELFGRWTDNHNDVIYGVQWVLTGRRNLKYAFQGPGDP
ncbi:hypothetical protein HK098_000553 [Nowakowskiella sp. JEL0407]|nr:hypothetical protein HK098_000553 [Nowakowskiella sp. JEL0407]